MGENDQIQTSVGDGWATFEEGTEEKSCEFSSFLSKDDQDNILSRKSSIFKDSNDCYTKLSEDPDVPPDLSGSQTEVTDF